MLDHPEPSGPAQGPEPPAQPPGQPPQPPGPSSGQSPGQPPSQSPGQSQGAVLEPSFHLNRLVTRIAFLVALGGYLLPYFSAPAFFVNAYANGFLLVTAFLLAIPQLVADPPSEALLILIILLTILSFACVLITGFQLWRTRYPSCAQWAILSSVLHLVTAIVYLIASGNGVFVQMGFGWYLSTVACFVCGSTALKLGRLSQGA